MFKNMKLGAKIGAGFAALILIAVTLGGLAVWSMYGVKSTANNLAEAYVPAVKVANDVERAVAATMLESRSYGLVDDKKYLEGTLNGLELSKKTLAEAKSHGEKHGLPVLTENAEKGEARAAEYAQLVNETMGLNVGMAKDKEAMNTAGADYMKVCSLFLESQQKAFEAEAAKASEGQAEAKTAANAAEGTDASDEKSLAAKLLDRNKKIAMVNEIIDLGNTVRVGAWKAIAGRNPAEFTAAQKKFEEINRKLDELKAITKQEVNLRQIEECRAAGKAYHAAMGSFLANWEARERIGPKRLEIATALLECAQTVSETNMTKTADGSQEAAGSLSTASTTMIIGLSIAVVVGILMAVFITRSIVGPITRVITGLTDGSQQVSAAAGQVSGASQQLAEGSSEQASSLEETSSSLEEMASMTKQNAANAKQANTLADEALTASSRGDEAVKRMADAIGRIKQSSDETARIIKVIDEIAFQTNLLALNAAVEAARAGEAGKGFAVVAEEVRNLAQRSAEAAKNTAQLIDGAQKNADDGVRVTEEVTEALKEIGGGIKKVNDLMAEVSAASDEQSRGIEQINVAVNQMDQVTQQVAANAEESAAASEELSSQAEQLNEMVADLAAVVGGSGNRADGSAANRRATRKAAHLTTVHPETKSRVVTKPQAKKTTAKPAAAVHHTATFSSAPKAEDTIPLDEHEDSGVLAKF